MDEKEFYLKVGDLIKSARVKGKKSQEELANKIGLSRVSVVNIEKGRQKIQLHNFVQAAEFLNINVNTILSSQANSSGINEEIKETITRKFTDRFKADSALDAIRITLTSIKK